MKNVDPRFREWACSLSGCDGGSPSASIWLCGIEWGYRKHRGQTKEEYENDVRRYYRDELPKEIAKGRYEPPHDYDWNQTIKEGSFGKSVAKLYMSLKGLKVVDYLEISKKLEDPKLFKLNLYPIPFRYAHDELWDKYGLKDVTGIESKEAYRAWCFLNRFPSITKKVKEHSPRLIIGTGITYLLDFFVCFAGVGGSGAIQVAEIQPEDCVNQNAKRYYWLRINEGKTLLAVIPSFSSPHGLNSDFLIQTLGSRLAKLLESPD